MPDQGFSETKFLSKTPIDAQKDAFLQREKTNLLNYDLEIKHISQAQGETEGTLEQQPSVENITLDFDECILKSNSPMVLDSATMSAADSDSSSIGG